MTTVSEELRAYFAGALTRFSLSVDLRQVTPFTARVLRETRSIRFGQVTSYGPRRVLYPQLVSMNEDEAGFGADPALFRDRCLADEIVRFAEDQALRLRA